MDVYALLPSGARILYECLTGRPPFLAEGLVETVLEVLSAEPVPCTGNLSRGRDSSNPAVPLPFAGEVRSLQDGLLRAVDQVLREGVRAEKN